MKKERKPLLDQKALHTFRKKADAARLRHAGQIDDEADNFPDWMSEKAPAELWALALADRESTIARAQFVKKFTGRP